ncbi:SMC-Scp complex subunit ScpB [Clostridium sp. AM58-1XD]|nr:SMC-Scp complex subunit ScpB [Clostridium sp. AM58-1XD]
MDELPPADYPEEEWEAVLEAVLFTMGTSVSLKHLAAAIGQDMKTAWAVVQQLKRRYDDEKRGMQIIELEDSVQMCTRARFYENLIRVAAAPKKQVLTDVMLETLSIIAYKQPVTKAEIEKIRGVKSDHAVNRLIEYNLVYEAGRLDAPGRPALFATTEEFLRRFGVGSVTDLPEPDPEQVEEFRQEAEEELQYTSEEKENQALKEAAAAEDIMIEDSSTDDTITDDIITDDRRNEDEMR